MTGRVPGAVEALFRRAGVAGGVPLAPLTTWKVGGPAEWYWRPDERGALCDVLGACHEHGVPVTFLGLGSNVLVADAGVPGLTVSLVRSFVDIEVGEDGSVVAAGGAPMPKVSHAAADAGFTGFEGLLGIPGTIGGGVVMNAGLAARGRKEIKDLLVSVEVARLDGSLERRAAGELDLSFRHSALQDGGALVLSARLQATGRAPAEQIRHEMAEHLAHRRATQPLSRPTAGSTFNCPDGEHGAGWYLDRAGLKGAQRGGAMVSPRHANWIVNLGGATAADIEALMQHMEAEVERQFGLRLRREVKALPRG